MQGRVDKHPVVTTLDFVQGVRGPDGPIKLKFDERLGLADGGDLRRIVEPAQPTSPAAPSCRRPWRGSTICSEQSWIVSSSACGAIGLLRLMIIDVSHTIRAPKQTAANAIVMAGTQES